MNLSGIDSEVWDYVVIGSGFGGSVAALRLAQKGYRVAVLEAGRRWRDDEYPKSTWDSKKYAWVPRLGWTGIVRVTLLRHAVVLGGAGVGGGSLMYGNTLFRPQDSFFENADIGKLGSRAELTRYFDLAHRMLGVVPNPRLFAPDRWIKETAEEYGRGHTFTRSPVGVNFSQEAGDPYFGGEGPERAGCTFCGGCFLGCRHNAKNTLDKNYLFFAEKLGAVIYPETEVCDIAWLGQRAEEGYRIVTRSATDSRGQWLGGGKSEVRAKNIVVAAGVMGTLKLLLKMKRREFPQISDQLGCQVMTNSEVLLGVTVRDRKANHSEGIAASSSVFPDEYTQIQVDRYPDGSDALAFTMTLMVDGGGRVPRPVRLLWKIIRHPAKFLKMLNPVGWARRSMILVVMQNLQSSLRVALKGNRLVSLPGAGPMAPAYIPIANDFARRLARRSNGEPCSNINEVLFNIPSTAHVLGGCRMGESSQDSVLDLQNRLHGYPNIRVCDGSMITTNLGVNPALSIAALAERAMNFVPPKEGAKPRYLRFEEEWPEARVLHGRR
jgi:cholesterol oxidase